MTTIAIIGLTYRTEKNVAFSLGFYGDITDICDKSDATLYAEIEILVSLVFIAICHKQE